MTSIRSRCAVSAEPAVLRISSMGAAPERSPLEDYAQNTDGLPMLCRAEATGTDSLWSVRRASGVPAGSAAILAAPVLEAEGGQDVHCRGGDEAARMFAVGVATKRP